MNLAKLMKVGAGLVALSALLFATPSQAAQPAFNFTSATTQALSNFTVGYKFTIGSSDITLSQLGVFDKDGDGLLSAHDVGIWDSTGTTLLTSTTIASGTGATLSGGNFRYNNIANLTLTANTSYLIGATTGSDEWAYDNYTGLSIDPALTIDENRYSAGATLIAPGTNNPAFPLFSGGNFMFSLGSGSSVPEPGTIALLFASGFSSLGVVARNRRIRK